MAARLSLAEQIAQLEQTAPDYDPEDVHVLDAEERGDVAGGREHYADVGMSSLRRKLHDSISDPKYAGTRTSRKQLMEDSESGIEFPVDEMDEDREDEDEDQDEDVPSSEDGKNVASRVQHLSPASSDQSSGEEDAPSEESEVESDSGVPDPKKRPNSKRSPPRNSEPTADATSALKMSREEDMKKGQAVKRQIAIWDGLLDARIRLQKSIVSSNKLPEPEKAKGYLAEPECQAALSKLLYESTRLAEELFDLEESLLTANSIINTPPCKRRKIENESSIADYAAFLEGASEDAALLESSLHPYFLQTLLKWSSKIQAVNPSVLLPSNKGSFAKGKQQVKSVNQLIDETLGSHKELLQRTQVVRAKRERIGVSPVEDNIEEPADVEAFDDTDFYQKMLREVIEARGNSNGVDWQMIQKQKKAKKKVDTKASKGRKLRFEVHEKIQNFMVPVPVPGAWHGEQVDELFGSLLGKGYEGHEPEESTTEVPQVELQGFRVFG